MTERGEPSPTTDCWGCRDEVPDEHGLGPACRRRLAEGVRDPSTPRLNELLDRLDSPYERLCWQCASRLATTLAGLCPSCHRELRD